MADGKDVEEIEVTPEMIAAGRDEWAVFDERFESRDDALGRIYRAMLAVQSGMKRGSRFSEGEF